MTDPYKVLGVSPSATDDEVKTAYRELAKKYHPDNYAGSPLADLANEKMKEVNEAYDTIMQQRRNARASGQAGNVGAGQANRGYSNNGGYSGNFYGNQSGFSDVRSLLMAGRMADAEQILNGVPMEGRNAEWFFLKGTVLYRRGWLEDAYNHFSRACQMDPSNAEYRAAMNQATNQRGGMYGGYNPNANMGGGMAGCGPCDACCGLMCMDSCCECCGGDLIPCC